ncbi:MAG: PTS sugar transporter subunit IIA [Desulfobacteraceae bacterium]|nr:PTS sugar transporter subunit IIA [Desulfobacteraceae bacterium]MCF8095276.1 PTS sugar transporter subunit IIA [Desulfobacteraceae bacterium]
MIGIVIVTHGQLGKTLIETASIIFDEQPENVVAVSIDLSEDVNKLRNKIQKAIYSVNDNEGIIILTDMFGGTPSNLSYSFLEEGRIEVISGVNLPVVIKAVNIRNRQKELPEMVKTIEEYGKKSISLASDILKGNKRE